MKKVMILMMIIGSVAMANSNCFNKDFGAVKKSAKEAKILKNDKSPMAKMKYIKIVADITKSANHIKDTHFDDMNPAQKVELNAIIAAFVANKNS
ncbi:MAG: hypothetical protein ACRC0Y_09650 [Fusobacteriaceae bacterium]